MAWARSRGSSLSIKRARRRVTNQAITTKVRTTPSLLRRRRKARIPIEYSKEGGIRVSMGMMSSRVMMMIMSRRARKRRSRRSQSHSRNCSHLARVRLSGRGQSMPIRMTPFKISKRGSYHQKIARAMSRASLRTAKQPKTSTTIRIKMVSISEMGRDLQRKRP